MTFVKMRKEKEDGKRGELRQRREAGGGLSDFLDRKRHQQREGLRYHVSGKGVRGWEADATSVSLSLI